MKYPKEYLEEIKTRSPIWKKEHYTDNQSDWLKGNPIVHEKNYPVYRSAM